MAYVVAVAMLPALALGGRRNPAFKGQRVNSKRKSGFTLIEVLIVVVIMAILAATIIPRMSTSTTDAKEALLRDQLRTLRTQIEIYKAQHLGKPPNATSQLAQLTSATDAAGNISPTGQVDSTHPYGPYLSAGVPIQPFANKNTVRMLGNGLALNPYGNGWVYQPGSGRIWADWDNYINW